MCALLKLHFCCQLVCHSQQLLPDSKIPRPHHGCLRLNAMIAMGIISWRCDHVCIACVRLQIVTAKKNVWIPMWLIGLVMKWIDKNSLVWKPYAVLRWCRLIFLEIYGNSWIQIQLTGITVSRESLTPTAYKQLPHSPVFVITGPSYHKNSYDKGNLN